MTQFKTRNFTFFAPRTVIFGKETYQLLLKTGVKLKVSLSGYRLLKERLGI